MIWNSIRPRLSLLFLLFFALNATAENRFAAAGQERPNFLLLLSDDQTYRALGILDELEVRTPNLDRLAKRGMLFTHCFNQGGWSGIGANLRIVVIIVK